MKRATTEVLLPDLGEIEGAVVVGWLRGVGDAVQEGDDLLEVETEKTTFVVPAPASGRLASIAAEEGKRVQVGDRLGDITTE
ncbi:MAG: lipoyl domain-containing protein [Candidatus Bipolaricaulota bacterium]|nr:lipoyl domain-containing protein [Candidatus Bipolaricaulota bacterium]